MKVALPTFAVTRSAEIVQTSAGKLSHPLSRFPTPQPKPTSAPDDNSASRSTSTNWYSIYLKMNLSICFPIAQPFPLQSYDYRDTSALSRTSPSSASPVL